MRKLFAVLGVLSLLAVPMAAVADPPQTMDGIPVQPLSNGRTDRHPADPSMNVYYKDGTTTNFGADKLVDNLGSIQGADSASAAAASSASSASSGSATGASTGPK